MKSTFLNALLCMAFLHLPAAELRAQPAENNGMQLVWSDEFDGEGRPDSTKWRYETGFCRNHEDQFYNGDRNCYLDGQGSLVIEARRETLGNPDYEEGSKHWARQRKEARYTSGSMQSRFTYRYGRVEVRAQLCTAQGAWPAIWQVGTKWGWPEGGEIDIMEYYPAKGVPSILANWCWGSGKPYTAHWNSQVTPITHWTQNDSLWASSYHIWTLDWTPDSLVIRLDGEVLNAASTAHCINPTYAEGRQSPGMQKNPFSGDDCPENLVWLNLALGGDNGGPIDDNAFPMQYKVDYVRVYQKVDP